MDPLSLGRKLSVLIQELVDGNPEGTEWFAPHSKTTLETVQKRKTPETEVEFLVDSQWEKEKEIEVFKRARTVAPEVGENFEMSVMRSLVEEEQLDVDCWMRAALKKAEEMMSLKEEVKELQEELEVERKEAKGLAIELREKDLALQAMRSKAEADTFRSQRAHKIEYDALTFKVQRTEVFLKGAVFEGFRTALQDTESKYCQLVEELSEIHLSSVERARLARGGQSEALQEKRMIEIEELEQYVDAKYKRRRF